VAAATAAMIGFFAEKGMADWDLPEILMICVPSTLTGVLLAAIVSMFLGKDLKDDPEYQARLAAGQVPAPKAVTERPPLTASAKTSALIFLVGVALVVLFGFFPALRTLPDAKSPLAMPVVIEILMLSVAAIMLLATKVNVDTIPKTPTLRAGVVAVIGIFGLAWLGDSFIAAHKDVIVPAIGGWAQAAPWTFAFGLFGASVLLYSQAATTRALMPLGMALGIPPQFLIAMFPSVNGYFFIPTYGSLIAAINFDLSGTTKIGKYVLNHSFMIPGLVATAGAVITGLLLAKVMF
jgi:anaerobic C4-dicarboxylate transporter DcuA